MQLKRQPLEGSGKKRRHRGWTAVLTILGTALQFLAVAVSAQETQARQGGPAEQTEFRSPMVLDSVFAPARRPDAWDNRWVPNSFADLRKYWCDNVTINSITWRAKRLSSSQLEVRLKTMLFVRAGQDKRVTLTFDVLNGESKVASATVRALEAEEKKFTTRRVNLIVPALAMRTDPPTSLRITMVVGND